ncbi:hypothetical protein L1987_87555 [Smallanthus sonchifolius]|nr:hypothetical protein L1987_87555 [Smallanthus sonchifolius]
MNLMNPDGSDSVNDPDLIESPTHVFPHNLPDYFVIDVDPKTVVNNTQEDHSNALSDYQSVYVPHFSPTRSNADDNPNLHSGEIPHLSPTLSLVDANSDQSPDTFSTYLTPNGTKMWSPVVSSEFKPVVTYM